MSVCERVLQTIASGCVESRGFVWSWPALGFGQAPASVLLLIKSAHRQTFFAHTHTHKHTPPPRMRTKASVLAKVRQAGKCPTSLKRDPPVGDSNIFALLGSVNDGPFGTIAREWDEGEDGGEEDTRACPRPNACALSQTCKHNYAALRSMVREDKILRLLGHRRADVEHRYTFELYPQRLDTLTEEQATDLAQWFSPCGLFHDVGEVSIELMSKDEKHTQKRPLSLLSHVLRRNTPTVTAVVCNGNENVDEELLQTLVDSINANTHLIELEFTSTDMANLHSLKILVRQQDVDRLVHLKLSECRLGGAREGKALMRLLETGTALTELDLSNNLFDGDSAAYIFRGLARNSTLKELVLDENNLYTQNDAWIGLFSSALHTESALVRLSMHGCALGDFLVSELANALFENNKVRVLHLGNNGMSMSGAELLLQALSSNSALKVLDLSSNSILASDDGATRHRPGYIVKLLSINCSLSILDLSNACLSDSAAAEIVTGIRCNKTLIDLYMRSSDIGDQTAEAICKVLQHNETIRVVDVSDGARCSKRVSDVLKSVAASTSCEVLGFEEEDEGEGEDWLEDEDEEVVDFQEFEEEDDDEGEDNEYEPSGSEDDEDDWDELEGSEGEGE